MKSGPTLTNICPRTQPDLPWVPEVIFFSRDWERGSEARSAGKETEEPFFLGVLRLAADLSLNLAKKKKKKKESSGTQGKPDLGRNNNNWIIMKALFSLPWSEVKDKTICLDKYNVNALSPHISYRLV